MKDVPMFTVFKWIGGIAALFTIVGGIAVTYAGLEKTENAEKERARLVEKHSSDIISIQHSLDATRIQEIDREIFFLDEQLRFGAFSPAERDFKEKRRNDLVDQKSCIQQELENCW